MDTNLFRKLFCAIAVSALVACSSGIKKAEIPSNADPQSEISRLETDIQTAQQSHADLFAEKDFKEAQDRLADAKEDMQKSKSQAQILDKVAFGRAYLNRALSATNKKINPDSGIVRARQSAIDAGAKQSSQLNKRLDKIDKDLRKATNDFEKGLSAQRLANFQRAYLDLELSAIKSRHLGIAAAQIRSAEEEGASRRAPKMYRRAMLDLKEAENEIMADRHTPARFESSVNEANASAQTLVEIMRVIRNSKAGIDEAIATRLVMQNRKIAGLESDLADTQSQVGQMDQSVNTLNQSIASQSATIANQSAALSDSQKQIELQNALKEAQAQFSEDEAEVYQRGDQLIIRLKKLNFGSGKSEIPQASEELLGKVRSVASKLAPSQVVVEGHTDSSGTARINKEISTERAEAVAEYLENDPTLKEKVEAIGQSYNKPIAPNKTREGRAQNRRVDIIITPGLTDASSDAGATTVE